MSIKRNICIASLMYCIPYLLEAQETSYLWDFGDGTTSTNENPVHEYDKPGIYTVSLVASVNEKLSYSKQYEINAVSPAIKSINLVLPDIIETGKTIPASVLITSDYELSLNYLWEFPDGLSLDGQEVNITLDKAGKHIVNVKAYYESVLVAQDNFELNATAPANEPTDQSNRKHSSAAESSSGGTLSYMPLLLIFASLRKRKV
ncbi:PKD domain-containing protein [Pseudoalteromonas luteoviolacea]|uniref:PKD domain-containing protein n=1 Tax=Pseudoalteromonas luteoviolacea TaxID=43657 RepID=UPI001F464AA0|nr:PKD domain-containing protein [Pseudoalteromonas luteoviolacea]MCF6440832.1 PKD domain-containing protein [Pseudoalteromonas luteoviolacea]